MTVSGTTSRISLVACTLWLVTIPAHAVDLNSQDLIPAPAGTDAILAYFTYATRDSFTPTGGDEMAPRWAAVWRWRGPLATSALGHRTRVCWRCAWRWPASWQ